MSQEEDIIWTLNLMKQPKDAFFQVREVLKDFQRCLEVPSTDHPIPIRVLTLTPAEHAFISPQVDQRTSSAGWPCARELPSHDAIWG